MIRFGWKSYKLCIVIAAPRSHVEIRRWTDTGQWYVKHCAEPYTGDFQPLYSIESVIRETGVKDVMALFHPRELL